MCACTFWGIFYFAGEREHRVKGERTFYSRKAAEDRIEELQLECPCCCFFCKPIRGA